ncbi:phosphate ABC transporter permease subunit PstC [Zongyangia hominis]|uniref:Phosphate transport system permease protein n=1 Tax=Zongyangia hominis TaxID=2763677 RepID=A0A926EDY4_9FIRM|nr:phosphate ABC transporter permease subunit PstC [Zongyangia hominis]
MILELPKQAQREEIYKSRRNKKAVETVFEIIFILCALVAVISVVIITAYMIFSGGPAIGKIGVKEFLFGEVWAPTAADPQFGILSMILASIYGTFGAILLGVPIGLLTSVFIAEIAPKKMRGALRAAVELLAGIPSVIYGLIGMIVVVPLVAKIFGLALGMCLFSAILILAVMVLPTIVNISETSLKAVPRELTEASLALGATQVQTIFKVQIPAARSGIMTGVVLGIGRAVGETMAVIMVAGNVVNRPELFGSVRLMTTGIVQEMSYSSGLHREALFAIGLVLFVFIMVLNLILNAVLKKGAE